MNQQTVSYPQGLEDAFHTFNRLSSQLAESYQILEARVAGLNTELMAARDDRFKELTEKERLANRLESLLNALPAGVVVLDAQGQVQEHNVTAGDLLGKPLLNVSWSDVIQRAFAPRSDDGHEVSLADGRRVSLSTCPLGTEPGQIILLTDVTEMRHLQDRLNQQHRLAAMGETAASLAHQIRTPLSTALLYASNLKRQHLPDEDRVVFGEKIFSRLRHLERLVNNMLLYARGNTVGEETFTLADLLADMEKTIEGQLHITATHFTHHDETAGWSLHGNRQMLLSALVNLAVNAMQAMGSEGKLHFSTRVLDEQRIEIQVSDTGPGMPKAIHQQIFEPFYTTHKEGTGLGLAVVAAVVSAHQGEVRVDSKQGEGCTFTINLPAKKNTDVILEQTQHGNERRVACKQ